MTNNRPNRKRKLSPFILVAAFLLSSCSTTETVTEQSVFSPMTVKKSYLNGKEDDFQKSDEIKDNEITVTSEPAQDKLESIPRDDVLFQSQALSDKFSDKDMIAVSANKMPLEGFLHYVLGELLSINYLFTPLTQNASKPVTLNLKNKISKRRLFNLVESILADRKFTIKYSDNVYLVTNVNPKNKSSTSVGFGRSISSVPFAVGRSMQIVPILYGVKTTLKTTVEQLADVNVAIDAKQSALFLTGDRENLIRALELIQLMDSPANRGRHIGLIKLTYASINLYLNQISNLLKTEGIPNSINDPQNNNLVFVPLEQIGAVAVFSATETLLNRVHYWTNTIDKPSDGDVKQYYVFHPKYARAKDLGESLTPLISAKSASIARASIDSQAVANKADSRSQGTNQLKNISRQVGASNNEVTFVVDERSNALIFYTTGMEYRNLIPLINRLDVLPKQVMLDIVIAEVNLTDDFKFGVEWALKNGDIAAGTLGAFGVDSIGGFSFIADNGKGEIIKASFIKNDQNVKILSNPSLLVRDGVSATIDIGADIAIIGSTSIDPDGERQTTSSDYRKTGIKVAVTPTINAKGVVIMDIQESISNVVPNSVGAAGNPNVFERNISTQVVAESGQTIILGGLIDEQTSKIETKVPLLGDIPYLGNAFKSEADNITKTELVLMVTPKVIARSDQWGSIMSSFENKLEAITIN